MVEYQGHDAQVSKETGKPTPEQFRWSKNVDRAQKAQDALIALKANIASPTFTGDPKAPTPSPGDNDTSLATTAFVTAAVLAGVAGHVLQTLQATYAANADLSTAIPADDTVPLIGEGTEVLTLAITPASASNKILCLVQLWGATITNVIVTAALFRGSTCINATGLGGNTGGSGVQDMTINHLDSPASASAQTYSVRVGPASGTTRLNGQTSGRLYGGTSVCTLTLMEIKG